MPVGLPLEGAAAGGEGWVTVSVAGSDAAVAGSPELPSDAAGEMRTRRRRGWRRRGLDGRWRRSGRGERRRRCFMAEMVVVGSLEFAAVLLMGFGWLQRRCQWMEHQSIRRYADDGK